MNDNISAGTRVLGRSASEWLLSLPVFLLLLLTLIIGTGEMSVSYTHLTLPTICSV